MVVYEHVTVCHTNFILGGSSGNLTLSPGVSRWGLGDSVSVVVGV